MATYTMPKYYNGYMGNTLYKTKPLLIINGYRCPAPSQINWSINPIWEQESGRDMTGTSHGTIVALKRKLEIEYPYADEKVGEYAQVLRTVYSSKGYFPVTYWDLLDNGYRTSTMYAGAGKGGHYMHNLRRQVTSPISFNLIEQ